MFNEEDYEYELADLTLRAQQVAAPARASLADEIRARIRFHRTWAHDASLDQRPDGHVSMRIGLRTGPGGPEQRFVDAYEQLLAKLGEIYPVLGVDHNLKNLIQWYDALGTSEQATAVGAFEWFEFVCRDAIVYLDAPENRATVDMAAERLEKRFGRRVDVRAHFSDALRTAHEKLREIRKRSVDGI